MKCNSCTKGYNGRNGNGYQPCGCGKTTPTGSPPKNPDGKGSVLSLVLKGLKRFL